jgi:hypothetical protein
MPNPIRNPNHDPYNFGSLIGGVHPGQGFQGEFKSTTQRNPDFERVGQVAQNWYRGVSPETQRTQAMAAARDLGVGLGREAAASRVRRGVSGSGVTDYDKRKIGRMVMEEANKAGLAAANKGQEMQLGGINAMTGIASGQSASMNSDLDRALALWQAQQQIRLQEQQLKLQQLQALMSAANQGVGGETAYDIAPVASRGGGVGSGQISRGRIGGGPSRGTIFG